MKKIVLASWLFLVHAGLLYFVIALLVFPHWLGSNSTANANSAQEHFKNMLRAHKSTDPFVEKGSVIFIGDSITEGLNTAAVSAKAVNYGISYDTTDGVLKRLSAYKSVNHASLVVLAIGVNDMVYISADKAAKNYEKILSSIPENIPVVISAVFPVDERVGWQGLNPKINQLNQHIKNLAGTEERFYWLDINDQMSDSDGNLSPTMHYDGVHLSRQGYRQWIDALKQTFSEIPITD